jgi:membrane associated rhomboid family serine protease
MGHTRYLAFYLLCGIAAMFAQALSNPDSPYPIRALTPALLLLLWFAVQLISDLAVPDGGASSAFRAHIGGFLTGMLLVPLLKRRDVALFAS